MERIDNYKAEIALRYAGCDAGMTSESWGFPYMNFCAFPQVGNESAGA